MSPYYCMGVTASWLLGAELEPFKLVLNPGSDAETVISPSDLTALRGALSCPEQSAGPEAAR